MTDKDRERFLIKVGQIQPKPKAQPKAEPKTQPTAKKDEE